MIKGGRLSNKLTFDYTHPRSPIVTTMHRRMARHKKKAGTGAAAAGSGAVARPPPPHYVEPNAGESTPLLQQQPQPPQEPPRPPSLLPTHPEEDEDGYDEEEEDGPVVHQISFSRQERARQYCSRTLVTRHLFSSLLARVWDFAIVLLLTVVGPQASFALIASYGIAVNVTVALFSPPVGKWIDESDRLRSVVVVTAMQNACTVLSGGCFLLLLYAGFGVWARGWADGWLRIISHCL